MDVIHSIVSQLFDWIQSLGYFGIMLGLMLEVIPSEIVLAYGGFLVSQHNINFFGAMIFGTVGGVLAQLFIYWIGRYGGRPVLERYGKYILIQKKHIDHSEEWFRKYGTGVIFTARFVPVVRHAISIPAGITKMHTGKFILLTTLAVIPWTALFIYLGMILGDQWKHVDEKAAPFITPILLVALALMIIYVVIKWMNVRKKRGSVK
ncbi:DedA family protein [Paenibacillus polysaccharolyticus]|uniref:Membrane protein DedA, SNARE-associated domain n=2 Tax=Paenibacillus TaxID=44249 RepID=A0A1G5LDI9_9BACL|nr:MULTISPECIES: DedA family protein [Paenibacillus]MDP9701613.1 membrane protein DedA with SNARE-associated domain [Paenibacillus intestini]MBY0203579.1 DedA family protein [Paenibacillus cucumis (ex Kampfer et al. 2016)]MCM3136413.1 DedA family protein [Paenibacillus polysaccharolyticus]MCP1131943.1 DedA family protein [Paenibacillus polysaccharolyticus]SCZ10368.1 membrane protein DedA, SNARE-associated domain [Paenibacillus polysaccharolyticus]